VPLAQHDSRLLEAAERAFANGYAATTMERIAAEAGLSRVTLHRRGVTKAGLLADLVARATDDYREAMWPALTGTGASRRRSRPCALTRTLFTEPLERLLRDGAADGSLRPVDTLDVATVLFNLVGWTYIHLRTGHSWPPQRGANATLDPVLYGLVTTNAAAPPDRSSARGARGMRRTTARTNAAGDLVEAYAPGDLGYRGQSRPSASLGGRSGPRRLERTERSAAASSPRCASTSSPRTSTSGKMPM